MCPSILLLPILKLFVILEHPCISYVSCFVLHHNSVAVTHTGHTAALVEQQWPCQSQPSYTGTLLSAWSQHCRQCLLHHLMAVEISSSGLHNTKDIQQHSADTALTLATPTYRVTMTDLRYTMITTITFTFIWQISQTWFPRPRIMINNIRWL